MTQANQLNSGYGRGLKIIWSPDLIGSELLFGEPLSTTTTTTTVNPNTTTTTTTTTAGPTTSTTLKPANPLYKNIGSFLLCYEPVMGIVAVLKPKENRYDGSEMKFEPAPFEFKAVRADTSRCEAEVSFAKNTKSHLAYQANLCQTISFQSGEKINLFGLSADVKKIKTEKCKYYPNTFVNVKSSFSESLRPSVILSDQEKSMLEEVASVYLKDGGLYFTKGLMIADKGESFWERVQTGSNSIIKGLEGNRLFFHYEALAGNCEPVSREEKQEQKRCGGCAEVGLVTGGIDPQTSSRKGTITIPSEEKGCWKVGQYITIYLDPIDHCDPPTTTTTGGPPTTTVPPFVGEVCATYFILPLYDLSGSWIAQGFTNGRVAYVRSIVTDLDINGATLSYYRVLNFKMHYAGGNAWKIYNETDGFYLSGDTTTLTLGPTGNWTGFSSGLAATVESPC